MATTIRFTEVLNNNGVAVAGITYQERAISSDNFKWAYAGAGVASGSRFLEFYDDEQKVERVCTITTWSYDALTATTETIVSSTVTGVSPDISDAPVGNGTAFFFNYENVALMFLNTTATTGVLVEYVFRNRTYNFSLDASPSGISTLATTSNALRLMSAPFPLNFINYNSTALRYSQASGASGCIVSAKFVKVAKALPNVATDTRYGSTVVRCEIELDTPNNLVLGSTQVIGTTFV